MGAKDRAAKMHHARPSAPRGPTCGVCAFVRAALTMLRMSSTVWLGVGVASFMAMPPSCKDRVGSPRAGACTGEHGEKASGWNNGCGTGGKMRAPSSRLAPCARSAGLRGAVSPP